MLTHEGDPGCTRYYASVSKARERLNSVLLSFGGRVTYVGHLNGSITVIWYMGKSETGFATARTEDGVIDRILDYFCRGL